MRGLDSLLRHRADLVRLAVPRRVCTSARLADVTEVTAGVRRDPGCLRGVKIVHQAPRLLHFTARLELP